MRFHSQYCPVCEIHRIFLEKLKSATDGNCTEMEDVCQTCDTQYYVKEEKQIKLKV